MNQKLIIERFPSSTNKSLQAWNAADELLLTTFEEQQLTGPIALYRDSFGYLSCHLHTHSPFIVTNQKSQEKAILQNLSKNNLEGNTDRFLSPLEISPIPINTVLVKVPKSLDLFKLYLEQLLPSLTPNATILAGFMTRHFSPQLLKISGEYFEQTEQSKAFKKARLLILKKPKKNITNDIIHTLKYDEILFRQYYGVFSADHIDYATQFLIENISLTPSDKVVLDVGCGNGVIGHSIKKYNPQSQIHFIDDSFLAVESAKLNQTGQNNHFYHNDTLTEFPDDFFDLIVTNPPFHNEYENTIEISLKLFEHVNAKLKADGRFVVVANKHLNYKTHLSKLFGKISVLHENKKFIIYECRP